MSTIGVKVTRAERRGRKILLTVEPDLFSGETFCVSPLNAASEKDSKLQYVRLMLVIKEKNGDIEARAEYAGDHYTQGHTQVCDLGGRFIDRKEAAVSFVNHEDEKYLNNFHRVLAYWKDDPEFSEYLTELYQERMSRIAKRNLEQREKELKEALDNYTKAVEDVTMERRQWYKESSPTSGA